MLFLSGMLCRGFHGYFAVLVASIPRARRLSIFHHLLCRWSPSLSREGIVLHAFLSCSFGMFAFLQKDIPLHSCNLQGLHGPENPSGFLPTCERRAFTPTQKWRRHFCLQRTKFAAFPLSLQNGKRVAFSPFMKLLYFI